MLEIVETDYAPPPHRAAIVALLDAYATDLMGGSTPLTDFARAHLVEELRRRPSIHTLLAFDDGEPVGLLVSNEGFSTFACRPLLNIHDLVVVPGRRGRGIGQALLALAEEIARRQGCCKLTLEVLEGNAVARGLYAKTGFISYELDPRAGRALFLEKKLG